MIFRICLISLLIPVGLTSSPTFNQTKISECAAKGGECDENKGRPVCGTDNETYPTRCHLIRAQCSGHQVSLKHRGACKDACQASRTYALAHRRSGSKEAKFIPKCRRDGSYAPVQCIENGSCWCVTNQGKPIPNTTTTNGRPNCGKRPKSNKRRSSPRNPSGGNGVARFKRVCAKSDRLQFNGHVISIFQNEFMKRSRQTVLDKNQVNDKMITNWKFNGLDTNKNHILEKHEYRDLKRIIKKIVKPKRCARTFIRYCDMDRDERITHVEWGNCLSKHVAHDEFDDEDDYNDYTDAEDDFDSSHNNLLGGPSILKPADSRSVFWLHGRTTLELKGENDPGIRESETESDCISDRAVALEDERAGSQAMYVPECTADGRYQRVQCYKSTGYCWCVNEDTGKNIPGTSTKDKRPQCDSVVPVSRPMKGCPEPRKTEFLRDLMHFLKQQIQANYKGAAGPLGEYNEDEKIATMSFVFLDKNKNKVWERKEWKEFREHMMQRKQLRKCGKKMPRYCDVNSDRKITLTEWLYCLKIQRAGEPMETSTTEGSIVSPMQSKLRGPNPLDSILKSD